MYIAPPLTLSLPPDASLRVEPTARIITDFEDGVLDVGVGVGLRNLLATKLHCDVMRVTKKFSGWRCVGKQAFRPVVHQDGRTTRVRAAIVCFKPVPSVCSIGLSC